MAALQLSRRSRPAPVCGIRVRIPWCLAVLAFMAGAAIAQPSRTTLALTLFRPDGTRFSGTITCSWPSFTSADAYAISAGNLTLLVSNGALNATLIPTDALPEPSTNTRYTCRYGLTNSQPLSPPLTETWSVPTAGPVTSLDELRTTAVPPYTPTAAPANGPFITYTISGSLSAERSLGTLADNSLVACDVATASCTPRAAIGTDLEAMSGWPSGLTMTELGYVNGVTSAIQTQLDAKVGVAANLTTAGAVPYVSASGVLNQDATKFFYNATNDQLGIGTDTFPDTATKVMVSSTDHAYFSAQAAVGDYAAGFSLISGGGGGSNDNAVVSFASIGSSKWVMAGVWNGVADFVLRDPDDSYAAKLLVDKSSGNVVIGGETDGNFKLDIQSSGSSGTLRVYDQTPTTGESSVLIQLGPSQLGLGDAPFSIHRNNGTELMGVDNDGGVYTSNGTAREFVMGVGAVSLSASLPINWSNTANDVDQTRDTGIARNAPGIVEANSGTPGTLRDILARLHIGSATSAVDSQLANSQFTFVLTSNTNLQIRARGSDGVMRSIDLTLAP